MSELPKGWVSTKFTDILDVSGGTQPPKSEFIHEPRDGYVRLLQIRDFGEKPVPTYIRSSSKWRQCSEDDILIGRYGASLGRICTGMEGAFNVALAKVVVPEGIDKKFLKYYLKSELFQKPLSMLSRSAQNGFNKSDLSNFDFWVAPLNEQIRVADKLDSILTKVNKAQERLEKIPGILKRFRQSVLAAATSGELTREWRELNGISRTWKTVKMASIVSKIEAGKNIKCNERPPNENELGIVKISAVTWGFYDEEQSKTLTDNSLFLESRRVKVGDFLISRANTIDLLGMPVIVHKVTKNLMLSDKVLRLVMSDQNKEWLNIFLRSPLGRLEIQSRATGNQESMRNIGQQALMDIDVLLPAADEKAEIVKLVTVLLAHLNIVEKQYLYAKKIFEKLTESILAKAFRGELVEQNPADEPADKLLERIKQQQLESPKAVRQTRKPAAKVAPSVDVVENDVELARPESEILALLKKTSGELSVQQIMDKLTEKTFEQVDALFTELKRLLDANAVVKVGSGEACTFKAIKR